MADPVSIAKHIIDVIGEVKDMVHRFRHNQEGCRKVCELMDTVSVNIEALQQMPNIKENSGMSTAMVGLEKAMERSLKHVTEYQKKSTPHRAFNTKGAAKMLDKVHEDILLNLCVSLFASSAYHSSELASIKELVAELRARQEEILVDEVQPVAASAESSCLLRIIGVSKVPGDAGSYKILSRVCETSKLVVYPPEELCFHFEPNKKASQPVTLTNTTNEYVGVWITPTDGQFTCPRTAKMVPNSTLSLSVTMEMHEQPPQDTAKFEVLMILVKSKDDLVKLQSSIGEELKMDSCFRALVKELQGKVYQAMLRVITCDEPESCQIISRSTKNLSWVTSTDVHPINPWIVTSHEGGEVRIWDYEKKKTVMSFFPVTDNKMASKDAYFMPEMDQYSKSKADPRWVYSAKFIARKNWLVVGDGNGLIHIYNYYLGTGDDKLCLRKVNKKPLRVYGRGKSVDSLAVHPTMTYLLLSSARDGKIKLWDWSSYEIIKEFDANTNGGVCRLMFNPRDTCNFACVTDDDSAKVWNMESSSTTPTTTLKELFNADYFFAQSHQHLMVTLGMTGKYIRIRDLQTKEVVQTLGVSGRKMLCVACHPTLPILATTLDDGTVCLWDALSYRLEKMIHITDSNPRDLTFATDTNGKTRLFITSNTRITILEVNLPMASTSQQTGGPN